MLIDAKTSKEIKSMENLTPGDLRAVWQRIYFTMDKGVTNEVIIKELRKELSYKNPYLTNAVGF